MSNNKFNNSRDNSRGNSSDTPSLGGRGTTTVHRDLLNNEGNVSRFTRGDKIERANHNSTEKRRGN